MNKQEFLDLAFTKLTTKSDLETELDDLIASEIEAYEKAQWKPYPENTPSINTMYDVALKTNFGIKTVRRRYRFHDFDYNDSKIIAFRELPKPYQP